MEYNFREIEKKWQKYWAEQHTFKAENNSEKPKYYVLDMFPYPSGAGLHVGHPLGYIASDIYTRYKRHLGFNVLHPAGYDSFGLPAEQYAIQTGQHPAITTEQNIVRYREQLDKIGFSFDWDREVRTSSPDYYKWTQWIFIRLFEAYFCKDTNKAHPVEKLIRIFGKQGNGNVNCACDADTFEFTESEWHAFSTKKKQEVLLKYRLAYLAETEVNWCAELGTVLANDEVVNGVSERGGFPVVRKKMIQWNMRITAYAERLLQGLETIDWPKALKESQRNWIGKSEGAEIIFEIRHSTSKIRVFTTRPDTVFGATFMTLAPEHELVTQITTEEYREAVDDYSLQTAKRSERERMSNVKNISGQFTGAFAIHPFTGEDIPIWISDYVLAGYGTGAIMAVPCGDQRDYDFAKKFRIPIKNIFRDVDISEAAVDDKEVIVIDNSDFLNGLSHTEAFRKIIAVLEEKGKGKRKVNYRLRDAVFSRQRYWGEPFPVYYKDGMPQMIHEKYLPLILPEVEKYLPTEKGEPPLARADIWAWSEKENRPVSKTLIDNKTVFPMEVNTMPGWAGSSWYFNRYMDARNPNEFASRKALNYWRDIDLYIGGSEHATGHLLYSRFWQKFLYDIDLVPVAEYAKKLINQGMILGMSAFVYRAVPFGLKKGTTEVLHTEKPVFVSLDIRKRIANTLDMDTEKGCYHPNPESEVFRNIMDTLNAVTNSGNIFSFVLTPVHTDVNFVNASDELDTEAFRNWRPDFKTAEFVMENGSYIVGREVEKMSKSKFNVVNPDAICEQYGADTLRMYEMFLGPLEQAKPWNTAGIIGVYNFLKKMWQLYHLNGVFALSEEKPSKSEYKILHQTIKKVRESIESFSFNTSVSAFMIAINKLNALKCNKRTVLEPMLLLISPYAPHIAEELWHMSGHTTSISKVPFPKFDPKYLVEDHKEYPVSFNGKLRFKLEFSTDTSKEEMEKAIMEDTRTQKYLSGRKPKKIIIVPGKIVNVVG